jgi:3-oxoadipate enol-lactonase
VIERTVTTDDGIRLHTCAEGAEDAPALLLCNSLGTDLAMWDAQLPRWSEHHRVLRFDQRGHGRSDAPSGPYSIRRLGRDALAVLDAYGVAAADVCGLSLGGQVALWVAANGTGRIRRSVLADTAVRIGSADAWRERAATVRREGMRAVVDLVLGRFFSPAFRASGDAAVGRVERMLLATPVHGYSGSCESLATTDLTHEAGRIVAPTLVVVGTADGATPPPDAEHLHRLVRGSSYAELPGAGHLANLEAPDQFAELVSAFLAGDPTTREGPPCLTP